MGCRRLSLHCGVQGELAGGDRPRRGCRNPLPAACSRGTLWPTTPYDALVVALSRTYAGHEFGSEPGGQARRREPRAMTGARRAGGPPSGAVSEA